MPLVHDHALCLRRLDYSETSQILLLFTRKHGLVRVIARGAKRTTKAGDSRFSGGLDLLEAGKAVLLHAPERQLSQLTEWTLIRGHLALRHNLRRLYLAEFATELVTLVFEEHDPHFQVFDDLVEVLRQLADIPVSSAANETVVLAFALRLLRTAGLLPNLATCPNCQRTPWTVSPFGYFSPAATAPPCHDCESLYPDRFSIDSQYLRLAASLLQAAVTSASSSPATGHLALTRLRSIGLPALGPAQTQPLLSLLVAHIAYQQGRCSHLAHFLETTASTTLYQPPPVQPHQPLLPPLPVRPLDPEPLPDPVELKPPRSRKNARRRRKPAADLSDTIISPAGPVIDSPPTPPTPPPDSKPGCPPGSNP